MTTVPAPGDRRELSCDVLVIGGGTAGTMAALTAAEHGADVILLEKAHVRHSGALAMGMDGVNNAVIPGRAEPDEAKRTAFDQQAEQLILQQVPVVPIFEIETHSVVASRVKNLVLTALGTFDATKVWLSG